MSIKIPGHFGQVERNIYFEVGRDAQQEKLTIYASRETPIDLSIAQCTLDNYGTQASADRQRACLERMRERGAAGVLAPDTYLIVKWHIWADSRLGEPHLEFPGSVRDVHGAYTLLTAIERKIERLGLHGTGPKTWRAALEKLRARAAWVLRNPDYGFELCTLRRGLEAPIELAA